MELIQTLLIDDTIDSEDETLKMTVNHKHTKDGRYLLNLGKFFLRLFADEEAEKGKLIEGKSRAYRYYTAVEVIYLYLLCVQF
jgi:hypothetical protein